MTVNDLTQLIGTLGFPIVACAALFWENHKQSQRHDEESERWAKALESNTLAITKLEAAIERMPRGDAE